MPRFIEYFLRFTSHWATVVIGIVGLAIMAYVYNKPGAQASDTAPSSFQTPGLAPSQDAGILGGIAAQRQAMEALRGRVETLQHKLTRLEKKPPLPSTDPNVTAALRDQLRALQQQVAARQQPAGRGQPGDPVLTPPPTSLRVIRQESREKADAAGQGRTRIEIAKPGQGKADAPAPYLPPQSFARGRVKDGYTGLASLETFPVTLEVTSAFSAPNGHTVPLTGCRFGATATPEEITARGRLRLTNMTCVTQTGQTIEQPVSGYVTASDNVNGQIAQVFWHEREVVAAFGKSAVPVAIVSLFRETRRVVEVASLTGVVTNSGNVVAQEVARRMADIYLDKAEKLASPVIWVGPDTPVYIYITDGARLEGLQTVAADAQPLARRMLR